MVSGLLISFLKRVDIFIITKATSFKDLAKSCPSYYHSILKHQDNKYLNVNHFTRKLGCHGQEKGNKVVVKLQ